MGTDLKSCYSFHENQQDLDSHKELVSDKPAHPRQDAGTLLLIHEEYHVSERAGSSSALAEVQNQAGHSTHPCIILSKKPASAFGPEIPVGSADC